jgi:hypothetical protein
MEEEYSVSICRVEMCMVRNWFSFIGRLQITLITSLLRAIGGCKERIVFPCNSAFSLLTEVLVCPRNEPLSSFLFHSCNENMLCPWKGYFPITIGPEWLCFLIPSQTLALHYRLEPKGLRQQVHLQEIHNITTQKTTIYIWLWPAWIITTICIVLSPGQMTMQWAYDSMYITYVPKIFNALELAHSGTDRNWRPHKQDFKYERIIMKWYSNILKLNW